LFQKEINGNFFNKYETFKGKAIYFNKFTGESLNCFYFLKTFVKKVSIWGNHLFVYGVQSKTQFPLVFL